MEPKACGSQRIGLRDLGFWMELRMLGLYGSNLDPNPKLKTLNPKTTAMGMEFRAGGLKAIRGFRV